MTLAATVPTEFVSAESEEAPASLRTNRGTTAQQGYLRLVVAQDDVQAPAASDIEYVYGLVVNGRQRDLRMPLRLEVEYNEYGVSVLSALLGVGGTGEDIGSAVADLADTAWRLWLEFREEPSDRLHESALHTRDLLARIFAE